MAWLVPVLCGLECFGRSGSDCQGLFRFGAARHEWTVPEWNGRIGRFWFVAEGSQRMGLSWSGKSRQEWRDQVR